jgi:fructose-1,6-bisphosphatase/inositol monophosphatase family enzyme
VHGESRLDQHVDKIKENTITCSIEKEVEAGGVGIEESAKKQQSASEI